MGSSVDKLVEELFDQVADLPAEQRPQVLRDRCADADVVARVERLLHHDGLAAENFLRGEQHGGAFRQKRIGPYTLLSVLGEGGMGAVYEAEQDHPRRRVALKLIRPGFVTPAMRRRFEYEADVLGQLEHPGVAHIYEAGIAHTELGSQPFFAMELVRGLRLDHWVRQHDPPLRRRLELLIDICSAVHHAHTKGVIHRDLKPSNILITEDGQPKILDFGVARAIESNSAHGTMHTESGQLVGTLPYMAPEQAAGRVRELDTSSDVYALGVIGYELLSGRMPYRVDGLPVHEAVRVICEQEPSRLSGIDRSLRGDVETIVCKSLEKDKSRRYGTAGELAADVKRFLDYQPISARRPSTWYQLSRFARRNKFLVGGVCTLLLVLALGVVGTGWQAVRASREADQKQAALEAKTASLAAEVSARRAAMAALDTLTDQTVERLMARQPTLGKADRAFLQRIVAHYDAIAALGGDTPESRFTRAEGQFQVGNLLTALGEFDKGRASYERAIALLQQLTAEAPKEGRYREALVYNRCNLAIYLSKAGQHEKAADEYRLAIALGEELVGEFPAEPNYRVYLGNSRSGRALLLRDTGKYAEALVECRLAIKLREQLAADFPTHPNYRDSLVSSYANLGTMLMESGRLAEAAVEYGRAVALGEQLARDFPTEPGYLSGLATSQSNLASLLDEWGRHAEAEAGYRRAITVRKQLAADFPAVPDNRLGLSASHATLGSLLKKSGKLEEAASEYRQCLAILQKLVTDFPAAPDYRVALARYHDGLGDLLRTMGKPSDAQAEHQRGIALLEPLIAEFPAVPAYRATLATVRQDLATTLAALEKSSEGEAEHRQAVSILQRLAADFPTVVEYRYDLAGSHGDLANRLASLGKGPEAVVECRQGLALATQLTAEFPAVVRYRVRLGIIQGILGERLKELGELNEAEVEIRHAVALFEKLSIDFPAVHKYRDGLSNRCNSLGLLLTQQNEPAEAEAQFRRAIALGEQLVVDSPDEPAFRHNLAGARVNLAGALARQDKRTEALAELRTAIPALEQLVAEFPAVPKYRNYLVNAHRSLASRLIAMGDHPAAVAELRHSIDHCKQLAANSPTVPAFRNSLGESHSALGDVLERLGKSVEAQAAHRVSIAVRAQLVSDFPNVPEYRAALVTSHGELARALRRSGDSAEALEEDRKALVIQKSLTADFPGVADHAVRLGGCCCNLGIALDAVSRPAEALEWYQQAIETLAPVVERQPRQAMARDFLQNSHWSRALALQKLKRYAEAASDWDRVIELAAETDRNGQGYWRSQRLTCLLLAGDHDRALADAHDVAELPGLAGAQSFALAARCASASTKAKEDASLRDRYAAAAIKLLKQAESREHFRRRSTVLAMSRGSEFRSLRSQPEFAALVARLEEVFAARDAARRALPPPPAGPFRGTPAAVPGVVQSEDYDEGGEGVAFHDVDDVPSGHGPRKADPVVLGGCQDEGGGHSVVGIISGEWLKYTVEVTEEADYVLDVRFAVPGRGSSLTVDFDGQDTVGRLTLLATGGWEKWQTVSSPVVHLKAGRHVMRVLCEAEDGMYVCNLNWINIRKPSGPAAAAASNPASP